MAKYRNSFKGFKHNKDYLDRSTGSSNKMGVKVGFFLDKTAGMNKLRFGRFAV